MRLTKRQLQVMTVVCTGNTDGSQCDIDQLLERLDRQFDWETTKQSLQFTLRSLVNHGLLRRMDRELRRGRKRRLLAPTFLGSHLMAPAVQHFRELDESTT